MGNEEFQKIVLNEFDNIRRELVSVRKEFTKEFHSVRKEFAKEFESVKKEFVCVRKEFNKRQNELSNTVNHINTRQDEIYRIVTAIEHSNQVGRAELDGQNFRLSKAEGKFVKAARVFNEEEKDLLVCEDNA